MIWTAKNIWALRRQLGLSQEKFARELGVTTGAVSRWEQGGRSPVGLSIRALDTLAKRRAER